MKRAHAGWLAEAYVRRKLEAKGYLVLDLSPNEGADLFVWPGTIVEIKSSREWRKAVWNLGHITQAEVALRTRWCGNMARWWVGLAIERWRRPGDGYEFKIVRADSVPDGAPLLEEFA